MAGRDSYLVNMFAIQEIVFVDFLERLRRLLQDFKENVTMGNTVQYCRQQLALWFSLIMNPLEPGVCYDNAYYYQKR